MLTSVLSVWVSSLVVALLVMALLLKSGRRTFIANMRGPAASSWLVGNISDMQRVQNAGDAELQWLEKYGTALKSKGVFGRDVLHLSDPKALHYIMNTGAYHFHKPKGQLRLIQLFTGKGILAVDGADHARHRKIMNPAFSYTSVKGFLPIFSHVAAKTASKWQEIAGEGGRTSAVIDVTKWLPRLTLDIIGEAALNYQFGAVDNAENELANIYQGLLTDNFHNNSNATIAFRSTWAYLPAWAFSLLPSIPLSGLRRLRTYLSVSFGVARRLVNNEIEAIANGKPAGKDAMSILVRANSGENPKGRLSDEELLAEMTTLTFAGHETTASALSWLLYELSRHPDYQRKIREEIKVMRSRVAARGDECFSANDLEDMTYTVATMKETLRVRPIGGAIIRVAGRDDTIPLSTPQRSLTGDLFTAIPISKGQRVFMSIFAYNRLKTLWGDDAHQWRPERFLEDNQLEAVEGSKVGLGVYANLATFSSGVRGCIGWRFAVLEIQAVMVELLERLEFSPPPGNLEIIAAPAAIVTPMVKGETEKGTQLPLRVTPL